MSKKQVIFTIKAGQQSVSILVTNHEQIRALIEATRETDSVIARKLGDQFILVKDSEVTFECFNETVVTPENWDELWRVHVTAQSLRADEELESQEDQHPTIDEIIASHADQIDPDKNQVEGTE